MGQDWCDEYNETGECLWNKIVIFFTIYINNVFFIP